MGDAGSDVVPALIHDKRIDEARRDLVVLTAVTPRGTGSGEGSNIEAHIPNHKNHWLHPTEPFRTSLSVAGAKNQFYDECTCVPVARGVGET